MANYTLKLATLPAGSAYSNGVVIPRNHTTVSIFTPNLLAVPTYPVTNPWAGQWKIQKTAGESGDVSTDVWADAYAFDSMTGDAKLATQLRFDYVATQCLVLPAYCLGAGVMRISTFDITQPTDAVFTILFGSFNN